MNKTIVGIIQARMGSKRFPGKMAAEINGFPLIDWVVRRVKQSRLITKFVMASSVNKENDYLEKAAKNLGIEIFRGAEENVLSRFQEISDLYQADIIVRICADNPFICSSEIDRIISLFVNKKNDYAFNHIPAFDNNYVDGVGAEILSSELLYKLRTLELEEEDLEHVTKYIWKHQNLFKISTIKAPQKLSCPNLSLDVDELYDLEFLYNLLLGSGQKNIIPEKVDVSKIIKEYKKLEKINN